VREAVQLAEMAAAIKVAFDKKELPALEPRRDVLHDGEARYLSDRDGRWHPHLMFFLPLADLLSRAWAKSRLKAALREVS